MKIVWLHEIINPPVEQGRKETSEHRDEAQHGQKRTIPIKVVYPCEIGAQCKYKKEEGASPPKPGRIQRGWRWTKKNFFNAMLTLFTAIYAIGFLTDAYVSKRAYVTPGTQDGKFVSFLPGDAGIAVLFRNAGQTPVKGYYIETWLLKDGRMSEIPPAQSSIPPNSVAAGYPIYHYVQWPKAPQDIPQFKNGEKELGIVGRVIYLDVFHVRHCEEFTAKYEADPIGNFISRQAMYVCNPQVTRSASARKRAQQNNARYD